MCSAVQCSAVHPASHPGFPACSPIRLWRPAARHVFGTSLASPSGCPSPLNAVQAGGAGPCGGQRTPPAGRHPPGGHGGHGGGGVRAAGARPGRAAGPAGGGAGSRHRERGCGAQARGNLPAARAAGGGAGQGDGVQAGAAAAAAPRYACTACRSSCLPFCCRPLCRAFSAISSIPSPCFHTLPPHPPPPYHHRCRCRRR